MIEIDPYFLWGICEFLLDIGIDIYREAAKKIGV